MNTESIEHMPPKMRDTAIKHIDGLISELDVKLKGTVVNMDMKPEDEEIVCKYMNRIGRYIFKLNQETSYYKIASNPLTVEYSKQRANPKEIDAIYSIKKRYEEKWGKEEDDINEIGEINDKLIL